jgi:hypothetical protein
VRGIAIGLVAVCIGASAAWGQPAPAAPAPAAPGATAADSLAEGDPAWRAYDEAFGKAAAGDRSAASAQLRDVSARWPQHPAAARATSVMKEGEPRPADPDAPDAVARGELVFWSTVGGIFTAANVCVIASCGSQREYAAVYTLTVGGSLGLAALASRRGVAQGEAQLYNSAQTWGSWNGVALNDGFARDSGEAAVAVGAQAGGLLAGLGLWRTWHPTQGDVALTNSFLLWSTVLTLWGHVTVDRAPTLREVVLVGDVGLVLGALTSTQVKMSRGRTLLIDVGGVIGILGGGLIAVGTRDETAVGVSLLLGTSAGLGIAALSTRDWDAPRVAITPTRITGPAGGQGWGVSAAFGF